MSPSLCQTATLQLLPSQCEPSDVSCFVCFSLWYPPFWSIPPTCQDSYGLSSAVLAPCWGGLCPKAPRASSALGPQRGTADVFSADMCVCTPTPAGLRTPAFICRLTNGIFAKLRTSSIYIFRACVYMSFLQLLDFLLLTEDLRMVYQ